MDPALKAYLDKLHAETKAWTDDIHRLLQDRETVFSKFDTVVSTPQPAHSMVAASDGGLAVDTSDAAVLREVSCSTTKALEVLPDASLDSIDQTPVTCSTDGLNQVVDTDSVNEVRDAATTVCSEPAVDLHDKEAEQLIPARAPSSIGTGASTITEEVVPPVVTTTDVDPKAGVQATTDAFSRLVSSMTSEAYHLVDPSGLAALALTTSWLVLRPKLWPSFWRDHAEGTEVRPIPWPSFSMRRSELQEWLFHAHLETLIVTLVDLQPWPSWGFTSCASTRADAWMCSRISGTNCGATQAVPGLLNLSLVAWSRTQRLSTGSKQKPCTARENYWAIVKSEVTQWMLPSVNCLYGNCIRLLPGQQRLSELCACSFTTAPKLQYPYLATMAAHLFHSRQKTGALSTKLSSSIFLQFMQLGPHELGCCVIFFVQSSYDICAQDIQLRVGFSQKHVQPKPPYFSGDCQTVRVWSELFKTELPYKICFSVTNLCWPATTSAHALGSVEYIGDLFLVLHEQSRKLDTTRNLVCKTQEHWNLSEHHILEHATACSIPMGDKLQRKIQLMTLSVHGEIFSQGDFNGSVCFTREYNSDQPEACCSTLNQVYHKLDNFISLSVEHPLSFTEPEPGVDACKHEQKAGDSSRVGVQLTILVTFKCYSPFGTPMLWWQHSSSAYGTDHCNTLSALSGKNSIDDTVGTIHHMIWKPTGAELNQPVTHPGTYISLFQPKPPWPLQVIILAKFSFSGQQTISESWHCSYCLCTTLQKLSEHVHELDGRSTVEDCNFAMPPALYHHQPFHRGTVTNWVVTMVQQHIIRTLFESSCSNDRQTSELPELDSCRSLRSICTNQCIGISWGKKHRKAVERVRVQTR